MNNVILLLAVGKGLIYLVQTLASAIDIKTPYFHKLFSCDLCLGVWVYFVLVSLFGYEITGEFWGKSIPVVSELITGGIFSLTMHYLSLGWKLKHGTFEVE